MSTNVFFLSIKQFDPKQSISQTNFIQKTVWLYKMLVKEKLFFFCPKFFLNRNIFGQKKFLVQKILGRNNFWVKKIWILKKIWIQKDLDP